VVGTARRAVRFGRLGEATLPKKRDSSRTAIPCRPAFFLRISCVRKIRFLFAMLIAASTCAAEIKINFSDYSAGQTPTNFISALAGTGALGEWKIVSDEAPTAFSAPLLPGIKATSATVRRNVLAQLSQDSADEHFPMFVYDGMIFKNFRATTQFKIVSGVAEQMAGMVFRWQNASNFYVVRASALGHNVRFYKVVNGLRGNPIGPNVDISTNVWHTLSVQCDGDQILFSLDGKLATAPLHDLSFESGKIGFWTMSDAVSYFDGLTVDYTPIVSGAQTLVNDMMQKYPRILGLRIYMPDKNGDVRVVASNNKKEIGLAGTDAEKNTLQNGKIFYGHGKGTVAVDYPLDDRNGDPIATVRVELKSYSFAETQDMVLDRVRIIINEMQKRVLSKEDLM
jgi:hypothetical protein